MIAQLPQDNQNYQATDQYGSNYRIPRPVSDSGGGAYSGFGMYDGQPNARPDGRPPGQPTQYSPQYQQPLAQAQPDSGMAGAPMTFAQMQQQGMARPPMPSPVPQVPASMPGTTSVDPATAQFTYVSPDASQLAQGYTPQGLPQGSPQGYSPYQSASPVSAPSVSAPPAAPPASSQQPGFDIGQSVLGNYQNYQAPGQFTAPTSTQPPGFDISQVAPSVLGNYQNYQAPSQFQAPANSQLATSTQRTAQDMLDNPSPYLVPAYQAMLQQTLGSIDDQFNTSDQAIRSNLAGRGLAQDGSTGLSDVRYNNLLRRSAQTDATTNLYNQLAQTYQNDRNTALEAGAGLQAQQYGQAQNTYATNLAAQGQGFNQQQQALQALLGYGQQGFNNQLAANAQQYGQAQNTYQTNLAAQNQGFSQQQQALQALLGYGQQGFNNQLATNNFNAQQDQSNTALLLQMLGYTG